MIPTEREAVDGRAGGVLCTLSVASAPWRRGVERGAVLEQRLVGTISGEFVGPQLAARVPLGDRRRLVAIATVYPRIGQTSPARWERTDG